ncbi:MAG TPA: hypothetical protein VK879_13145 [Candidatus Sulfomarinibacteraceae bacterium]|nr:hypothetical protein [Candidatus Sulfomarinibacteraceae bacterium]
MYKEPLAPGTYYHIYNRGINDEIIFKEERNYPFFLKKMAHYILPVAEVYAYCLLPNHFHLLVRTHDDQTPAPTQTSDFLKKSDVSTTTPAPPPHPHRTIPPLLRQLR